MRRFLLGLITALIVARPLVLGEDPGLLDHSSSATGLTLTVLWFLTAVGWAVWRAWSGEASWPVSAVEAGLLAAIAAIMVSAIGAASYKYPAWLMVSEWFVFLIAFVLVRQLARTEGDNRRLLAALLASAVSLSAFAIYQGAVELPSQHKQFENPQLLVQALAREGIHVDQGDPQLEHWKKRVQSNAVFATFAHPNSFAGFLALLLPAAVGLTLAARRRWKEDRGSRVEDGGLKTEDRGSKVENAGSSDALPLAILHSRSSILDPRSSARVWLLGVCALVIGVALWLTNGRGAILTGIVAVGAVVVMSKPSWWVDKRRLLAAGAAVVAVILLVFFLNRTDALKEESSETMQKRFDYWTATWSMIRDHPWLGVGPGHFGRFYPRYMKETAFQKIKDPHNFVLEIWSTCGIAALLAVGVAIGAFFWGTRRAWLNAENGREEETPLSEARWPFYFGGMGGLTLAFVLWSLDLGKENLSDQMTVGTCLAGMRSLVWFAAFGLFESIPWTGRSRARALTIGMTALLTTLLVTGGISYPSVAQPMWIVAALAVNSLGQAAVVPSRSWLRVMTPLPVTAAVCLGFLVFIYSPVTSCSGPLREARSYYGTYSVKMDEAQQARSISVGQKAAADAQKTLEHIINQLKLSASGTLKQKHEAVLADPYVELAEWLGVEWERNYQHGQAQIDVRQSAASAAEHAIQLDPEGQAGYWAKYHVNMIFAKGAKTQTRKFYEDAAKAMSELVQRDPTEAKLHFELGDLQFQLDDLAGWEKESQEALRLDQLATDPTRQLKPSQRLVIQARKDPTNIGLRFDLAQAFYREGDTEKGKKTAEEMQRMDQETNSPARLTDSQRQQVQAWLKSG